MINNDKAKTDIRSMSLGELEGLMEKMGEQRYRAKQLFGWFHVRLVSDLDEMGNIPASLKEKLRDTCDLRKVTKKDVLISGIDGTRKYLFQLSDGNLIESVLMKYRHGNSVCVSSQVGCAMGCRFCASTIGGLIRNLTPSEMLSQVYEIRNDTGERVSNIVIMGMGEPLTNYDNVLKFIRLASDENTLHISQRNITISTCGIVPAILNLRKESLKCTLAISLHAPSDEVRRKIMPIAEKYTIKEIMDACDRFFIETGRRVTFEYCLINGINDGREHAVELAGLLKGKNAHVNLIPVNPVPERQFSASDEQSINYFRKILENEGITVTRRREMGRDISGACGQLARRTI